MWDSLAQDTSWASKGPGPEVVAGAVSRIVASRKPRLRNCVTREATLFPFLRWLLLPAGSFEAGIRSGFNLDKERVPGRVARERWWRWWTSGAHLVGRSSWA
jgi:hypothetical protein